MEREAAAHNTEKPRQSKQIEQNAWDFLGAGHIMMYCTGMLVSTLKSSRSELAI